MSEVGKTVNVFLRFMCAIYLFAFLSFYIQSPGLYGDNGILPAKYLLEDGGDNFYEEEKSFFENFKDKPTLVWFAPYLGLSADYMLDLLALVGAFFSFCGFVSKSFCIFPVYLTLWVLYYSLFQVGQTFMLYQWDVLLLEAGFICMLCAPVQLSPSSKRFTNTPTKELTFFLVKWLLFRLMFASGVVKLTSGCPSWWNLTALEVHFETQPLPTPLAWFAHHLPTWTLRLATVYAFVVEQLMPFLFFFPLRSVRITGFFFQVLLQAGIILTGNYNFYNLLTIVLAISLLDDKILSTKKADQQSCPMQFLNIFANIAIHGFIFYVTAINYNLRLNPDWSVSSGIAFTKLEFDQFLKRAVPASIYIGGMTLFILSIYAIWKCFKLRNHKLTRLMVTVFYICLVYFMFGMTLVPHAALHKSSNTTVFPAFRKLYSKVNHLHIANSYGLFKKMTGLEGRPEIVLEGSDDVDGPWTEYHFKYKPTDINTSLAFVFPHQPRLDWQMWYASLGTYHQNPWLMSLVYRLLCGEKEVMRLMNTVRMPFKEPPKYIRASLYEYHFSSSSIRNSHSWWQRQKIGDYFPVFAKNHTPLNIYLEKLRILNNDDEYEIYEDFATTPWLKDGLEYLREITAKVEPVIFIWSVFLAACLIVISTYPGPPSRRSTYFRANLG